MALIKSYFKSGSSTCPYCGGPNITNEGLAFLETDYVGFSISCGGCGGL